MVYWSIFTENKAVIYVKTVQICCSISHPTFHISKNPSVTRCSIWCRLTNFSLNFKNPNSKSKKWILVKLSITVTCRRNIHILIRSPLKMKLLHLLWKFHGYIFHSLGEKWMWKLPAEILPVDLKSKCISSYRSMSANHLKRKLSVYKVNTTLKPDFHSLLLPVSDAFSSEKNISAEKLISIFLEFQRKQAKTSLKLDNSCFENILRSIFTLA